MNVTLGAGGALAGTSDTAASFNGTNARVRLPDNVLWRSHNLAVELWFKTTGAGVLFSYQDRGITEDPGPADFVPVLYVGSDGKLRGELWQGHLTPVTSPSPVNDGAWHHVVLSGAGSSQTMYLDGEVVGSLSGTIRHNDMSVGYIGTGFVSRDTNVDWPAGTNPPRSWFNGSIDEVAVYYHPLGLPAVREHFAARAQADLLTTVTLPSGKTHAVASYDVALDRVSQLTDANGGTWAVQAPKLSGSEISYKQTVLSHTPHGYWQLNETDGTTAKDLVAGRNGSYMGVSRGATGVFPQSEDAAGRFNRRSWVQLPDGLIGRNAAVELWFKTTGGGVLFSMQEQEIRDDFVAGQSAFVPVLYVGADGKLRGQFWDGATNPFVSPSRVDNGRWHHAVMVAATSWQAMYLDGVRVDERHGTIDNSGMPNFYVGAGFLTLSWPSQLADPRGRFQGEIDEVAVYRHSLPAGDVAKHFNAVDTPLAKEVTATEPSGHVETDTFDPLHGGRQVSQAIGGFDRTFTYDTGGFLRTVTDANGHTLTLGHDERGNIVSRTTCQSDIACSTSYFEYFLNSADPVDPRNDRMVSERDGRSTDANDTTFLTTYQYTAAGDLASVTAPATPDDPDGHTTTRTYTDGTEAAVGGGTMPPGLLQSVTTPAGRTTSYAYRANGDLAEVTQPSGLVHRYQCDELGRMVSQTEVSDSFPSGVTTTYAYDGWSRLTQATGPPVDNAVSGVTHQASTTYVYDDDGNLASQTTSDLLGGDTARTTTYGYDAHNRLTSTTDAEGGVTTATYDTSGDLVSQIDAEGNERAYTYFPDGHQLASVTLRGWTGDPNAPSPPTDLVLATYQRDPAGRVAAETDAMGRTRRFEYFDDGALSQVNQEVPLAGGGERMVPLLTRSYDGAGNMVREFGPDGSDDTAFTYDAATRLTRQVLDSDELARQASFTYDPDGNVVREELTAAGSSRVEVTEHAYDAAGREVSQTVHNDGGSLLVTTFAYDQRGLLTARTDPRGNLTGADPVAFTTNFGYDKAGRQTAVTLPPVQVESLGMPPATSRPVSAAGYNTFGNATHAKDANGNITTVAYDRLGRPVTTIAPTYTPPGGSQLVPASHVTYDRLGRVTQRTDPLGHVSTFAYDQLGNLASMTQPAVGDPPGTPGVWRFTYTTVGEQLSATDPAGARVESTYDVFGRRVTRTQVERHPTAGHFTTTFGYDDAGNLTSVTNPLDDTSTFTYNDAGELLTATGPASNTTTAAYDLAGRLTRIELADSSAMVNTYDLAGRLVAQADETPSGAVLRSRQLGYDPAGNQTSATSALGFETTWAFDAANRMVSQVEPVSATEQITTSFGYDAVGNRTRFTDGRGNATIHTFNTLGLPEQTIEPTTDADPTVAERSYTTVYDAAGQPVTELLPGGIHRDRVFDQLGRLTSETGTGAEAATTARTLGYDPGGRLVAIGTPGGTTSYTYNDRGLLLSATGPSGNATFAYDAAGRLVSRTDAAGTSTFGYTSDGLLASASETLTGATRTYSYDNVRQLTEIDFGNGVTRAYDYDDLHRLTSDSLGVDDGTGRQMLAEVGYGYDLDDRVTSRTTVTGDSETFTYDHASRLVGWAHDSTTTSYAWDKASNRTSAGGQTATFDQRNRQLTQGTNTFTYTARGTLASRTSGTDAQTFAFDAFNRQTSAAGLTITYDSLDRAASRNSVPFTYADQSNNLVGDSTSTFARDPAGALLGLASPAGANAVMQDLHGDVIATFHPADGQLAATTRYSPYGTRIEQTGTQPALGFQGAWTDPQTGQANMHARWYAPATGTFTTRDSIPLSSTPSANANRYTYALANPLGHTDPTGHLPISFAGAGAGGGTIPIGPAAAGGAAAAGAIAAGAAGCFTTIVCGGAVIIGGLLIVGGAWAYHHWSESREEERKSGGSGGGISAPWVRRDYIVWERGGWMGHIRPGAGRTGRWSQGGRTAGGGAGGSLRGCASCGAPRVGGSRGASRPMSRPRWDPRTVRIPAPPASSLPHINIRPPVDPTQTISLPGSLAATAAATLAASTQAHLAEDLNAGEGATASEQPVTPPATCAQHPGLDLDNACQPIKPDGQFEELVEEVAEEALQTSIDAVFGDTQRLNEIRQPGELPLGLPIRIFRRSSVTDGLAELRELRRRANLPDLDTEEGAESVLARLDIGSRSVLWAKRP